MAQACLRICLIIALIALATTSCNAQNAINIVAQAVLCFNNQTIYKNCQQQYRLTPTGIPNTTAISNSTNSFCSGPCMVENNMLLRCVDGIFSNFQFYNGASIQAMGLVLNMACGNGSSNGNSTNGNNTDTGGSTGPQSMAADLPKTSSNLTENRVISFGHLTNHVNSIILAWLFSLMLLFLLQ